MTTPTEIQKNRDERLKPLTDPAVLEVAIQARHQAVKYDAEAKAARQRGLAAADELIRVRKAYRVAPLASELGVTFQALRGALQKYWDAKGIDFSPDDRPVLSEEDKITIRGRYAKGGRGNAMHSIAGEYGIAPATVRQLVVGITPQGHVPGGKRGQVAAYKAETVEPSDA
jgi:hypothetical protein